MHWRQEPPPGKSEFCHQLSETILATALPGCMLWMQHIIRQYTMAFGHRVAGLLPAMASGVRGLRVYKAGNRFVGMLHESSQVVLLSCI